MNTFEKNANISQIDAYSQEFEASQENATGIEPFPNSETHLWMELARVDQWIRAAVVRWQYLLANKKSASMWGMLQVDEREVDAYLNGPFTPPYYIEDNVFLEMENFLEKEMAFSQHIKACREITSESFVLRLDQLQALFKLSDVEKDVLLLSLLPELDSRYRRLYGYLQDDASQTLPSVELLLFILMPALRGLQDGRKLFAPQAPLLKHQLLALEQNVTSPIPLSLQAVRLDDRITGYLFEDNALDERLNNISQLKTKSMKWNQWITTKAQLKQWQSFARVWETQPQGMMFFLNGAYGSGKQAAAQCFCNETNTSLLIVDVDAALNAEIGWEKLIALIYREARLQKAALYWAGCEHLINDTPQAAALIKAFIQAAGFFNGVTFFASEKMWCTQTLAKQIPFFTLEFPSCDGALREKIWTHSLPPTETLAESETNRKLLAQLLAVNFQLSGGQILDAIASAQRRAVSRSPQNPCLTVEDLYAGCRKQSGQQLVHLAQRMAPGKNLSFDNLVLPKTHKRQLQELQNRIELRHQVYSGLGFEQRLLLGKGLIALFTGTSGTGKTMAAQLLANGQGLDLYKINLAAVVSKWVGETEKNLERIFKEAEQANGVLFFDEADALFGKRSEVKEANDRYANIEINFLLQRIEEFSGTVILATNLQQNMDQAFLRRIHCVVEFPFPNVEARLQIWKNLFPSKIEKPSDKVFEELATRFPLAGGSLRNIVVDAAFRALSHSNETAKITTRQLVASIAREYQKMNKPITKRDFGEQFYEWLEEDILMAIP